MRRLLSFAASAWRYSIFANPFAERLRYENAAVGLLIILHDRNERPADGDGGAVECVDELRSFFAFFAEANVEPPGLIVRAVTSAGDFAEFTAFAAAGHPGFEVVFSLRRTAEVAADRIDYTIGNTKAVE